MNYIKIDEAHHQDQFKQVKPATTKRDLLGGLLKKGSKVLVYHKLRMFIQNPNDKSMYALYDIEPETFDDFFELDKKTA